MILNNIIYDVETNKPVEIDLDEIIAGRAIFQANSRGGKSYLVRRFLEATDGKIQRIVIDPEGEYHTLREKYDLLLVGKEGADIQIDTRTAPLLAKKLMETGASAILDLYELNSFERMRFVKVFLEALINLPKKLWHPCIIVIDEIHIYAPESSKGRSESLEAVAALASRGGKRGYALIGATQKISKFHKDVSSELNIKFIGRCSQDIDQKRAAAEIELKNYRLFRNLKHEFYFLGPQIETAIKVKSYPCETKPEKLGKINQVKLANPGKIKSMLSNFVELPQEAENELKTKQDLNRKITEQNNEIVILKRQQPNRDPKAIEIAYQRGLTFGQKESKEIINTQLKYIQSIKHHAKIIEKMYETISDNIKREFAFILLTQPDIPEKKPNNIIGNVIVNKLATKEAEASFKLDHDTSLQTITDPNDLPLGRCEKAILETLAKFNKPCSKVKIGIFAGYSSKSGGFSNAISKLKNVGFVTVTNGDIQLTDNGAAQVVFVKPLPTTNEEILSFWINKVGRCPGEILKVVVPIYPNSIDKMDVGSQTNYSANSGGFSNAISKLRTLGLIEYSNGQLKATEDMFP